MEPNDYITKLKANGTDSDLCDLDKSFLVYKEILQKLNTKDKTSFSLNVLCILCRNIDKVPSWREKIDNKALLTLSIECVRHTRTLTGPEQVKTLACIYHIHKHIVKQSSTIPPELILKLSFMPFEYDEEDLLKDYCKTYWSILADRLTYIEKLKTMKLPVSKLLPKLIEDIIKVINMYDTVQFCVNLVAFLVKKFHFIYNESTKEVNESLGKIFDCISKKDLKQFKKLTEKECLDLYVKLNDCICIIAENSTKINFKESVLESVTRTTISLLGHRSDMFHCLQTFYLNSFCCVFNNKADTNYLESIFNNILISCETTEKLGYKYAVYATYPFISQLLRLYIENIVNNQSKCAYYFNESIQGSSLKLMLFLLNKLRKTNQLLKCENCGVKTGLHDALRLSFLVKHFILLSTSQEINMTSFLPTYFKVVEQQYTILHELNKMGCANYERCFRKLQTDVHNTAILLNKSNYYEYSIKLFEIYLQNEFKCIKNDVELKNISRALYNKSICELDFKLYKESLKNAFLSLIFALPDGLGTEKYMSLVMDIKAKALKNATDNVGDNENQNNNDFQLLSIMEVCKMLYDDSSYGNMKPYLKNLKFSALLKHEFTMYAKLWPSIVPIAGVWRSMLDLVERKVDWIKNENEDILLWSLYETMIETPNAVRTIHDDNLKNIVTEVVQRFDETLPISSGEKFVYTTLLFLQSEYDITDASQKFGWKATEHTIDPDNEQAVRTIEQEHSALKAAVKALEMLNEILPRIKSDISNTPILKNSLQISQVFVQHFLHMHRTVEALQLANVCCQLANIVGDKESFVRNAGVLIYHTTTKNKYIEGVIALAIKYSCDLMKHVKTMDVAAGLVCEVAIYYARCGAVGFASQLVRSVQTKLLTAQQKHADVNLDLTLGRLLEAQIQLCLDSDTNSPGLSTLSAYNTVQRHYLAVPNSGSRWSQRRLTALSIKHRSSQAGVNCIEIGRALRLWRRARSSAAASLPISGAIGKAIIYAGITNTSGDDAQVKIDNRLKYILGLQSSSETNLNQPQTQKHEPFTPKQIHVETMLDSMFKKVQISPSLPCITIPAFTTPEFFKHEIECVCHACQLPISVIIACHICYLEASMYFRAKEFDIARNYFNGALHTFAMAEAKLKNSFDAYKKRGFDRNVLEVAKMMMEDEFRMVHIEFLIELSHFELSQKQYEKSDDFVVRIHEIMADSKNVDVYLKNEVYNLMVASVQSREFFKKPIEISLESEMDNLKLSPAEEGEPPKTPETKNPVPVVEKLKIVKAEEIPKKRKVIKLNLDEAAGGDTQPDEDRDRRIRPTRKHQFKIPVPVTAKPVLETMTPRPTRSKPDIVVQQPSLDQNFEIYTPKSTANVEFFTPCGSTPNEQFFTPMTSLKTYSKKSIVKNLEMEFSTPKCKGVSTLDKEVEGPKSRARSRVESGSVKTLKDKRTIKRVTSPGKLVEEKKPLTRPRRIRQPNLTDDK